ncbi:unannotated protein [freshwater metagenome]|uniref:Unannotated protein n=1 Tax=freshwater metagenome TaxID=449393 RepID=A0A6J6F5P8_9ZZZZ
MVARRRSLKSLIALLAGALLAPAIVVSAATSSAQVVSNSGRNFTLRYSNNINGQITIAANTLMQCPTATPDPAVNSGCAGARAGTNSRNNNTFDMGWLDVDSDPSTFDSSQATLNLPSDGVVLFAGLYWTGIQKKGEAITGANGYVGVPLPPPNASAIGQVKFKLPDSSAYQTVTAANVDLGPISVGSGYGAFADVTELVTEAGPGTYTVADVQTGTGGNTAAGWSLVVAYADQAEPLRNLSVFDGLKVVSGSSAIDIALSGFKTPSAGTVRTTIGVVAAEGDAGATGDYLSVNDNLLTDAVHPSNNTENSTIANRGAHVTTKNPDWRNQLGYDSSLFSADGFLPNGATNAMFRAKTSGDTYAPQAITFATELFSPQVDLTKTQSFPVSTNAEPGATIRYTITATNNGSGPATNVELVDPLPGGTTSSGSPTVTSGVGNATFVSNSVTARLGSGATPTSGGTLGAGQSASVEFDVVIDGDAALGSAVTNTAQLRFVSPDLGLPISKVATRVATVTYPDPAVVKTIDSTTPVSGGTRYRFKVLVSNAGTLPASSQLISVSDVLGSAATNITSSGSGWSCSSGGAQTLNCQNSFTGLLPGTSLDPLFVEADFAAGQPVTNTATVSGGGQPTDPNSPALLNDVSSVSAGISPVANLRLAKSALTGTVSVGALAGYRLELRNSGPAAAGNSVLVDTVPAYLDVETVTTPQGSCTTTGGSGAPTTVSCALGTVPVGTTVTVVIRARVQVELAGTTVINTATAGSDVTPTPVTDTAPLTIRPATDLSIVKTTSVEVAQQGDAVSWTVTASNDGGASATNLQIVDRLPVAVDAASVVATPSSGGSCTRTNSTVSCVWSGATAASATRSVTITASFFSVVPADDRLAINNAKVFAVTDDFDPSNNTAFATTRITPFADLEAAANGPGIVAPGETATLSFTALNNGPTDAVAATMVVTIPTGLSVEAVPSGCIESGVTVTCALGDLANGASATIDIEVRSARTPVPASRDTEVVVASNTADPIPENDVDLTPLATTAAPTIDSVTPGSGPESGGTEVTVDGTNLTTETTVEIGGVPCEPVIFVTTSQLICTTGPQDPGVFDVVVTTADGQTAILVGGFTYGETPDVKPSFTG